MRVIADADVGANLVFVPQEGDHKDRLYSMISTMPDGCGGGVMGKSLSVAILFAVLLLIATVDVCAVENLILNGDFEVGPGGWLKAARGVADMKYEIDDEESISEKRSARLEILNTGAAGIHDLTLDCDTPIKIKAGETYTVDFWVKAEEERTITIDFLMNHDPWTRDATFPVENIPITTEWDVQHHTFKAGFGDVNMIFLFSFSRASNQNPLATMWIDRVRFYEGDYEEEDLAGKPKPKAVDLDGKLTASWAVIKLGD